MRILGISALDCTRKVRPDFGSMKPELGHSPGIRYFAYNDTLSNGFPSPWKAAFPESRPMGYWEAFAKRCATDSLSTGGLVDAKTARRVWLSILGEYEDYERMGMWIPEQIMEEHRQVAVALGWR